MAYKDKDKQRAYQRQWVRHKRGSTGSTDTKGSTAIIEPSVTEFDKVTELYDEPMQHSCSGCTERTYNPDQGMSCPRGAYSTSVQTIFEANVNPDADCTQYP